MKDFLRKISSRKLWAAIAGVAVGIAMIFKVDEGTITTIAGAITALGSIVAYITTEGRIDAANVGAIAQYVEDVIGAIEDAEEDDYGGNG